MWEIDVGGCEVRLLRSRLGLDSGYLSRLLRSLEASGLVSVTPGERDRRVRTVRLTTKGKKERALLDRRSDALALSMLAPLADDRRVRLVAAMTEVERLLTVSLVELVVVDPSHPDARYCLSEYSRSWTTDSTRDSIRVTACLRRTPTCDFPPACSWWQRCAANPSGAEH